MKTKSLAQLTNFLGTSLLLTSLLVSCSSDTGNATSGSSTTTTPSNSESSDYTSTNGNDITVGIIQFAPHPSLDNCATGTIDTLKEAGYDDIDLKIADGKAETTDIMAKTMVASGYDIIIPIATPAAMSAYSATKDSNIPVVFSAVADPLSAGLARDIDNPQTGATGTADALNLEGQLEMIRAFLPDATKIGVLYTNSEPNSLTHLEELRALAPEFGFSSVVAVGINNESEVSSGAVALLTNDIDCVTNFTDNNVVNNLSMLLNVTNEAGIPVFGSEEEQVKNGCLASESLDYVVLGNITGELAVEVLEGSDVMSLPVRIIADSTPVYNQKVADALGIEIPESYSHATNVG